MADQAEQQNEELERTMGRALTLGTPLASVAGALVALLVWGAGPAVLVLVGGALLGAIVMLWSSLRSLVGDAPIDPGFDEAVVRARVSEANERKRMVLRALKDLENERDIGKIDEADYATLAAEYRARAKAVLREMDDELAPQRERAEKIARAHLQKKGLLSAGSAGYRDATPQDEEAEGEESAAAPAPASKKPAKTTAAPKLESDDLDDEDEDEGEDDDVPSKEAPEESKAPKAESKGDEVEREDARPKCAACGTSNDADATFCKKCGARVSAAEEDES